MKLTVGPTPLYSQLEQDLSERIAVGEFLPGRPLPTEEQLGERYGVSRITVRKALDSLLKQGLIVRRRGAGSFVLEREAAVHSIRLTGSLGEFLRAAQMTKPLVLSLGPTEASPGIAGELGVEAGSTVLRLELVSLGHDGPIAYCEFYLPAIMIGRITMKDVLADEPVMQLVERQTGTKVVRVSQMIDPDLAGPEVAYHLGIPVDTPILRTHRVYHTASGVPIEVAKVCLHPQRYRYAVELLDKPS